MSASTAVRITIPPWSVHDDVIKWKQFLRYWSLVPGIDRSPVSSQHKGQWRGALVLSLVLAWTNSWANNGDAGDLRRHRTHYDAIVIYNVSTQPPSWTQSFIPCVVHQGNHWCNFVISPPWELPATLWRVNTPGYKSNNDETILKDIVRLQACYMQLSEG